MSIFLCRAVVTQAPLRQSWANTKVGMKGMLAGVGLLLLLAGRATAEPQTCDPSICAYTVLLASVADEKVYGLLISNSETGCRMVRYRVETAGRVLLGKTPALAVGDVAMVRIGNGFQPGAHTLLVTAEGCTKPSPFFRQVTLRKASPDHGWRAALANAALANLALVTARQGPTP
jgi:hypothetical protein